MKYLQELYNVYKIRKVENKLLELYAKGFIGGTVHTCIGQEYTGVFISKYLKADDIIFSNHRGHGHYISKTNDISGLIAEILSKKVGISGGYGGSQHLYRSDFISNGIQGSLVSVAGGRSFAFKQQQQQNICVIFIGDGTLGQGAVYEALNVVSLYNCPVLIVLEDNEIAQSTPSSNTYTGQISKIIEGFGINFYESNIWDLDNLDKKCLEAISYVKTNFKPAFLKIKCARLNPHSKGDDNRAENHVKELVNKDILNQSLDSGILNSKILSDIDFEIETVVENLILLSNLDFPDKANFIIEDTSGSIYLNKVSETQEPTLLNRINICLKQMFESNKNLIHIGEDIEDLPKGTEKIYGGAFKVTKGLSTEFPNRVFNTPIAESTIIGFATGYSLSGNPSIAEIMFGDFLTLGVDQLVQNASKFKTMYGKKINLPIIVRTPMGGRRGYGPTHSQSIEKLFFGIHGLNVIAINKYSHVDQIYNYIINEEKFNSPTLILENKLMYNEDSLFYVPGHDLYIYNSINGTSNRFIMPSNNVKPKTLFFAYGYSAKIAEEVAIELFLEYEESSLIFVPESISPLSLEGLDNSLLQNISNLICIEEGCSYGSTSEHILSYFAQKGYSFNNVHLFSNDSTIPSSPEGEKYLMPTKEKILETLKNVI